MLAFGERHLTNPNTRGQEFVNEVEVLVEVGAASCDEGALQQGHERCPGGGRRSASTTAGVGRDGALVGGGVRGVAGECSMRQS